MKRLPTKTILAAAAALLLSSCASFTGIQSAAQPRNAADFASSASLPSQDGQWPDSGWVASIGGPQLQALIDEALARNPNLQAAAARVAAAQAMAEAAGAAARPTAGVEFTSTYQRYTENGMVPGPPISDLAGSYKSDNMLAFQLSWDLDFWNRHGAELRAALSQEKAAQAEQYAACLMLATSISRAWVQLARQYAQLDLIDRQIEVRKKIDQLVRLRHQAGLDTRSDSEQARQQSSTLLAEQTQWQEAVTLTRNQLAALLGQGPDRGLSIERPALPPEAATALPADLPLSLLGRRPDIVAARWRVEAMLGDIDAAKALFYPNVNLTAFAGFSSIGLSNLLESGSRIVGVGPAIRIPLFESGSLRANLKGKVAAYDNAVATYNQALTEALRETADQVQSLRAAETQGRQQHEAAQAASAGLQLARERERVGTANMLPALAAELNWLGQRRVETEVAARRADLRIGLIKALGGGFDATALDLAPAAGINQHSLPSNTISAKSAS